MNHRLDRTAANATIAALADLFPAAFSRERWQPHKPLKIGIDRNLITSGVLTEQEVHAILWQYTRRYQYLVALARGGPRYDLTGQPCSEVSPDQQAAARIAASHVEAIAENQFRDSRAQFYSARRTKPKATPQPVRNVKQPQASPPAMAIVPSISQMPSVVSNRRITLSDLRRLGQQRKATVTQTVGAGR